jgi:hypothetical protein
MLGCLARPRPPLDSGRSLLRRSVGANLGDLPVLLRSPARNADGADDLAVGDNWDASFERCRSRQGKRAQADTALRYQVLEHFARPSIIKRTMRLFSATRIEPYWVLSSLCSITVWPLLSRITTAIGQLFFMASDSAAAIAFLAASSPIGGP